MLKVERYSKEYQLLWDSFVSKAKNQSFLFYRDFMDYHKERFSDYSLMVYKGNTLLAIIPANVTKDQIISHQGLSYGGVLFARDIRLGDSIEVIKVVLEHLNNQGIKTLVIKLIPKMYQCLPSDELDWILFKIKGKLIRRDTALAIDNRVAHLSYQKRRRRSISKASKMNLRLAKGHDEIEPFWSKVLEPSLLSKHGVAPVHTLDEILLLASRFPENIQQHTIYLDESIVAGCTVFLNKSVAHAQYISGSDNGRNSGCLDFLFDHLLKEEYSRYNFFDFGICNEQEGLSINKGLLDWKEGFGARTVVHDFYRIDTSCFVYLNDV